MNRGILVHVLRPVRDPPPNGITSKVATCILCGPGIPEEREPSEKSPGLLLIMGDEHEMGWPMVDNRGRPTRACAVPLSFAGLYPRFGGCFVTTAIDRLPVRGAIPVFDD